MSKFEINKKQIDPGTNEVIKLNVARLPSGTVISLRVHVYRSKKPGPTLLVLGGVHGDEINGVEIVRRTIEEKMFENLEKGSVIAIPLLNIYGFINFSRDASDGKDVNRSFPGSLNGSLASRVAATLTRQILPLVDMGVDFHTGGSSRFNYPQIRYTKSDKKSLELARAFAPPIIMAKPLLQNSLRKTAINMKIPLIVYEGGESLRLDGFSIENGLAGIRRIMYKHKMSKKNQALTGKKPILFEKSSWIRATKSGMFTWSQESGAQVSVGEPLGVINDPYGEFQETIKAKRAGYIVGHNNAPVVSAGDALFNIAYEMSAY